MECNYISVFLPVLYIVLAHAPQACATGLINTHVSNGQTIYNKTGQQYNIGGTSSWQTIDVVAAAIIIRYQRKC